LVVLVVVVLPVGVEFMELLPEVVELRVELNREEVKVLFSDDDVEAKIRN
jgi:hypothetical protein